MDKLDFVGGAEAPIEDVQPEVVETQAEPQTEATSEPSPLVPPVIDHKPEPGFVPITVVMDERDKRRNLEAELAALKQQQVPAPIPDVFEDPQGFAAHQANIALNVKLDLSEDTAREKYGDEAVDQARDWAIQQFQSRPGFKEQVLSQRNPYRFVVEQYQREQIASNVTADDYAQFQAWKAAQAELSQQPQAAQAATPSQPSPPPRSIASAPSAGGVQHQPSGPGQAYDGLFS